MEETLNNITDGCVFYFVESTDDTTVNWTHRPEECERAEWRSWRDLDERFRRLIKFEESSHSRFRCGFSQRLCSTGVDEGRACQWPNVAALLRGIPSTKRDSAIVKEVGFEGETTDAKGYASWLGTRYRKRVSGEQMSDASAPIVNFIVERAKERAEANATNTDDFRIDDVGAEDIEAAITANEAEVVQTIDRRVVAGATFYEAQEGDDGSVHAYRE